MKVKVYRTLSFIIALMVAVFTVGYAFAWILNRKDLNFNLSGNSAGSYFARGDGSKDNPFVITNETHMHNLAVLQNTGRLDRTDGEQYYFEINDVPAVEMKGYIPPIGNDEHPFNGIFNGNGRTISGLKVTTNKSDLQASGYVLHARDDYKFSNAVGLFGATDSKSQIYNFFLDKPSVHVENTDTKYYDVTESGPPQAVGFAVGYVAGKCSSIGVKTGGNDGSTTPSPATALDIEKTGYSTFNSILGNLKQGVTSSVTGGGHGSGGSGSAFGASFDVENLLVRLNAIKDNKASSTPSWRLPNIATTNTNPVPDSLRKVAFSVTDNSTYTGADAIEEVADNNIGYFMGNQNKIVKTKELTFDDPMVLSGNNWVMKNTNRDAPRWFYTYKTESGSYDTMQQKPSFGKTVFAPLTQEEFDELPQDIKDLLPEKVGNKKRLTAIRLSETYNNTDHPVYNNGIGGWSFHGQISLMGKTYGKGFMGNDGYVVDINGESKGDMLDNNGNKISFKDYTKGIYLPNNAIWFKPSQVGTIRFVIYAASVGEGFALVKITRNGATAENPFYSAPNVGGWGEGDVGKDILFTPVMRTSLPNGVLLYYEHNVTAADIAANNIEYMILQYGAAGADFVYLDIGASAAEDVSEFVPTVDVSAIDFVCDNIAIDQSEVTLEDGTVIINGNFTGLTPHGKYDASRTSIYFEGLKNALNIVYIRLHSESNADKTMSITSTPADNDKEIMATNASLADGATQGTGGGGSGGGTVTPTPDPGGDTVAVTGVTLSETALTIATTESSKTLTATVTPSNATNKTVTWTSSDSSILSVADGVLTVGSRPAADTEVEITATAGGITATCKVTVKGTGTGGETGTKSGSLDLTTNIASGSKETDVSGDGVVTIASSKELKAHTYSKAKPKYNGSEVSQALKSTESTNVVIKATKAATVKLYISIGADSNLRNSAAATITPTSSVTGKTYSTVNISATTWDGTINTLQIHEVVLELEAGESVTFVCNGRLVIAGLEYSYNS